VFKFSIGSVTRENQNTGHGEGETEIKIKKKCEQTYIVHMKEKSRNDEL
jgi:hypothetical protein